MAPSIVVDRIEGEFAVLLIEDVEVNVRLTNLPEEVREGSVLALTIVDGSDALEDAQARLERLKQSSQLPDEIEL